MSIGPCEPGLSCASSGHIKRFGLGLGLELEPKMISIFLYRLGSSKKNGIRAEFGLGPNS